MKKQLTVVLLSAAAVFAQGRGPGGSGGFGGPGFGRGMEMGGRVVTGAPYSGVETLTTQEKFADGNSVNTSRSTQRARDGQGRTYSSEAITPAASTGKAPYTRTTIIDPVAGARYELDSSSMIAYESRIPKMPSHPANSTSTAPTPTASTRTLPNGATQTVTPLGTQTVNGVQATGTQITETIPAGAIGNAQPITSTRVTWISTDLHIPVQIRSTDARAGTTDMEVSNISTGEPSATLFAVPSGYTVQNGGRGMGRGPRGLSGASGHPGGRPGGPGPFGRRGGPPPQ